MKKVDWQMLVINLPGGHQTMRMRLWRALKAAGAAALRDGVYVLPDTESSRRLFGAQRAEIEKQGGSASVLRLPAQPQDQEAHLRELFDRTADYAKLLAGVEKLRSGLGKVRDVVARRRLLVLRREIDAQVGVDFFPGAARDQLLAAYKDVEVALTAQLSPGEPHAAHRAVPQRSLAKYQGRVWATRERLWIDRICSAWLIRRFIDPKAKFMWLKRTRDIPRRAVGFDFDGAEFTHVDTRVTFEVLLQSFALDGDPALRRLADLVHFLDVGGVVVPEAGAIELMLRSKQQRCRSDDLLLREAQVLLDDLYAGYAGKSGES
jgi:hypothetical protein